MSELTLTLSGNTLPANITQELINYGNNELKVPPSYLITLLNYESYWGSSAVGQANNNWAGMTWGSGWSDPHTRDSGVVVKRGTARPSNEGGYYIRYQSVPDFIKDWTHLFRRNHIYKVADSKTFDLAVKGMFRVGGATYDYATMNVETSQERYELYLRNMKARRNAINNANNNILNRIDNGEFSNGSIPDPDPEPEPEPPSDININELFKKVKTSIQKMVANDVFQSGNSSFYSNSYIQLMKQLENTFKIKINKAFFDELEKEFKDYIPTPEPDPEPEPDPDPPNNQIVLPMDKNSLWVTQEYGGSHNGIDLGVSGNPINTRNVYAVTSGTVSGAFTGCANTNSQGCNGGAGNYVVIEHDDGYSSRYLHLGSVLSVSKGDKVKAGQVIGKMANSGTSTGSHLHFEVSRSIPYNRATTFNPKNYVTLLKSIPNV